MSMDNATYFNEDRYNLRERLEDIEGVAATLIALTTSSSNDGPFGDALRYLTCQLVDHQRGATEALDRLIARGAA